MHVHRSYFYPWSYFYPSLFIANGVTGIRDAGAARVPLDTLRGWRREIHAGARVGPPRQILSGLPVSSGNCSLGQNGARLRGCFADSAKAVRMVDSLEAAGADMIKLRKMSGELYLIAAAEAKCLGIPVLLDADPLADITNTTMIRAVVANGCYFDRAALAKLLAEVRANGKRKP